MDARRFDLLARGVASFGTRRSLLRSFALLAAGAVPTAATMRTVLADSDGDGTAVGGTDSDGADGCPAPPTPTATLPSDGTAGGTTGNTTGSTAAPADTTGAAAEATAQPSDGTAGGTSDDDSDTTPSVSTTCPPCPPSGRPQRRVNGAPPFPVFIVGGTCDDPSDSRIFNLIDAGADEENGDEVGSDDAISVASSVTSLRVTLDDLLDEPHAVIVRAGTSDDDLVACGEIGGIRMGGMVNLGIQERNGSGFAGIAQLSEADDQTRVSVFVARDLFDQETSWEGLTVVTTGDVNLRSDASEDAGVVSVIGEGTSLTVTDEPEGDWLPVVVDETGEEGFVSSEFVEEEG